MFKGFGIFNFSTTGYVINVDEASNFIGQCHEKIIIVKRATPDIVLLFNEVKGILCEYGGTTCHLALLAREMSIPCIVGISNITKIKDYTYVEINSYNGEGTVNEIK